MCILFISFILYTKPVIFYSILFIYDKFFNSAVLFVNCPRSLAGTCNSFICFIFSHTDFILISMIFSSMNNCIVYFKIYAYEMSLVIK